MTAAATTAARAGAAGMTLAALAGLAAGCTGTYRTIEAIGKDPSSGCLTIQSPYAALTLGRANRPGAKVNIAGAQCTIEHAPAAGAGED